MDLEKLWTTFGDNRDDAVAVAFFARKKAEIDFRGYCIMEEMGDPFRVPTRITQAMNIPHSFPIESLEKLYDFMETTFPGEEAIKDEKQREHWNPIINSGDASTDLNQRNGGHARISSTTRLLIGHMESDRQRMWAARRRAALDLWMGWLLSLLNLDNYAQWESFVPKSGGRFLMTGKECPAQVGHNDFAVVKGQSPGYFAMVTGTEQCSLWVCPASNNYVLYDDTDRRSLARVLKMTEIVIPRFSIFFGHGHLQHAGSGWTGFHSLRYHMYVIPTSIELPDAVHFAFECNFEKTQDKSIHETSTLSQATNTNKPAGLPATHVSSTKRSDVAGAAQLEDESEEDADYAEDAEDEESDDYSDVQSVTQV